VAIAVLYLAAIWLTLVFWTYRDIRQRTRDPILQTVAVLLVLLFFLPGHWIYLIVRPRQTLAEMYERSLEEEALLQELEDQKACPTCKRRVQDDYLICPSCRTQLKESCRSCSRPLSYAWLACPYCGLEKPPREGFGPRPARQLPRTEAPVARVPQQTTRAQQATAPASPAPPQPARLQADSPGVPRTITRPTTLKARDPFARGAGPATNDEAPVIGE
jgi:RNA polymerase subunit RPABC4/transcription elongation factor Spt4